MKDIITGLLTILGTMALGFIIYAILFSTITITNTNSGETFVHKQIIGGLK